MLTCSKAHVDLRPSSLRVVLGEEVAVQGELYAEIKREDSTWFIGAPARQRHGTSNSAKQLRTGTAQLKYEPRVFRSFAITNRHWR